MITETFLYISIPVILSYRFIMDVITHKKPVIIYHMGGLVSNILQPFLLNGYLAPTHTHQPIFPFSTTILTLSHPPLIPHFQIPSYSHLIFIEIGLDSIPINPYKSSPILSISDPYNHPFFPYFNHTPYMHLTISPINPIYSRDVFVTLSVLYTLIRFLTVTLSLYHR